MTTYGKLGIAALLFSTSVLAAPPISWCFSPTDRTCEQQVVQLIDSSHKLLYVAAYSLTSDPIANAIVRAHKRGTTVRVVLDKQQTAVRSSKASKLQNARVPTVLDTAGSLMHHKYVVADATTVLTGSYNFTNNARRNYENFVIIQDGQVVGAYLANFINMWQRFGEQQ